MEKIEIKDFVGIKDISIEIKQINILIGSQASGKSITTKLLYYFKNFIFEVISFAEQLKNVTELEENYVYKFTEYFPPSSWGSECFTIKYSIDSYFIKVSRSSNNTFNIKLEYSDLYETKFTSLKSSIQKYNRDNQSQGVPVGFKLPSFTPRDFGKAFLLYISEDSNQKITFSQLYIPAGRSFYANLKKSLFHFISVDNSIESFLIEFGRFYEQIKERIEFNSMQGKVNNEDLYNEITKIKQKILCGRYIQKNGEDYLEITKDRQVELVNSSSGQQETLPLTITLETIAYDLPDIGGNSIYIEEPESHIFPTAQKSIVELISTVYNARKDSLQFFITTHSPYILTAFNNLIQAGILAEDATEEKIEQISHLVPQTRFLNPDKVAVYSLEDGYCKSIIDEETGLIDASIIDEVSKDLAIQFDELLDLE